MAKLNRPKLATHYSGPRAGDRDFVSLEGRCVVGEGAGEDIAILDLDERGCRVKGVTAAVTKSDVLQVWLGDVGPIEGRLRWAKRGSAGIAFIKPLGPEELALAKRTAVPSTPPQVIPLRRRAAEA
ncbi:hypothetical protein GCM10011515_21770 [Tsuneonella deserti]|uniref:PilZ domain-containing protein n=1 Tax=Tsuneonella deserti TaxID=2035528 RepID=A0ABQ1SBK0_9SPHN|nr:hypothetical protein [Tsuneonella deserti]GGE01740.1 hypothetical protein GCM10011515_21770 [Tsuneonella deserti]